MEQATSTSPTTAPGTQDLFALLLTYEQRSLAHDAGQSQRQQKLSNWSGIAFRLRDHNLACPIDRIEEVIALPPYTPIPGTHDWLLGIANVRGNLAPVSDLGWYLFGHPTITTPRSRLILTRFHSRLAGLLVDEVLGQRHFHTDDLESNDHWQDSPLAGLVDHSFPVADTHWGVFQLDELEQRPDFMNGARNND